MVCLHGLLFCFKVISPEVVREVEARMNREYVPPPLPLVSTPRHNHRISQVSILPTVQELHRHSGIIDFIIKSVLISGHQIIILITT